MTRPEFDAWVVAHYSELIAVARKRLNQNDAAVEVVHNAVVGALEGGWYARSSQPWTRMVLAIKSYAHRYRETEHRHAGIKAAEKNIQRTRASHGWKKPAPRAD